MKEQKENNLALASKHTFAQSIAAIGQHLRFWR